MLVSRQARFLFVHVPKTGGLSVREHLSRAVPDARKLRRPSGRHPSLRRILLDHPDLADHWTFGFVRDPWSRLVSWHSMILRREEEAAVSERTARLVRGNDLWRTVLDDYREFEAFVLLGLDDPRLPVLRKPQVAWLRAGERRADFVGRQETFAEDMAVVCARLGIDAPSPSAGVNRNPTPTQYRDAYTPAMRRKVGQVFGRDVRAFDYEF